MTNNGKSKSGFIREFVSKLALPGMRIKGKLLRRFKNLHADWVGAKRDHEACLQQVEVEQKKAEYKPLLDLMRQEAAYRGKLCNIERNIIDTQVEVAKQLDISPDRICDYFIDTDTGVVSHKQNVPESETEKQEPKNHIRGGIENGTN